MVPENGMRNITVGNKGHESYFPQRNFDQIKQFWHMRIIPRARHASYRHD